MSFHENCVVEGAFAPSLSPSILVSYSMFDTILINLLKSGCSSNIVLFHNILLRFYIVWLWKREQELEDSFLMNLYFYP